MKHICNCVRVAFYQMDLCYGNVPDLHSVDSWFESGRLLPPLLKFFMPFLGLSEVITI